MFLVDTNVWLEALLEQNKASEVRRFLKNTDSHELSISEFALYSIGVILSRLGKKELLEDFLSDVLEDAGVERVRLDTGDLRRVLAAQEQHGLDFDDAYQYVAAEKHDMVLVSFDTDFDRTPRGRKSPGEIVGQ